MSEDCDDDLVPRVTPDIDGGGGDTSPDPTDSQLVTVPTNKVALTARADFDVHTAITNGLAAYLMQLDGAVAGRSTRIGSVITDWADLDDGSRPLPSAAVHSEETGSYQTDSGMAPGRPTQIDGKDDRGRVATLTGSGIYQLSSLMVDVRCDDKVLRAGVRLMLEDAFWPVEWMSGFRLVLPRYHSAIATYLVTAAQFGDSADTARARLRPLSMRLLARCPVYRTHYMPLARPQVSGNITIGST